MMVAHTCMERNTIKKFKNNFKTALFKYFPRGRYFLHRKHGAQRILLVLREDEQGEDDYDTVIGYILIDLSHAFESGL